MKNNKTAFSGFFAFIICALIATPVLANPAETNSGFGAQGFVNKAPAALDDAPVAGTTTTPKAVVTIVPDNDAKSLSEIAPAAGPADDEELPSHP